MRIVHNPQMIIGAISIEDIEFDPRSRDDITAVLRGIRHVYCDEQLRGGVRPARLPPAARSAAGGPGRPRRGRGRRRLPAAGGHHPATGRPGMDLWQVLVLALLKQGINCDFDRLADLANEHLDVRRMLGLPDGLAEPSFTHRTLARNVSLLTPALLAEVNQRVVVAGLRLAGVGPDDELEARADSFFVETSAQTPTVRLLHQARREHDLALAPLLNKLNQTLTVYPGTNLRMVYKFLGGNSGDADPSAHGPAKRSV